MVSLPSRQPDRIKNAEIDRLLYQVHVIKIDAKGLAEGLTREQLNWSPGPGRWSVAQCLDHLNAINAASASLLERAVAEGRRKAMLKDGPYAYGFLSRWFLKTMEPPVTRRVGAPRKFRPAAERSVDEVLPPFLSLHERIEDLVRQADGLDLVRIKVPSPVTSLIRYSLGMAFWLLTAHDRRHLWQARQVLQDRRFPHAQQRAPAQTATSSS
ncbi:MAG: DinB family protein [Bryobacteraceae bacterium]|nr:DinB family protein [Bryobacteraceae bacterium]